MWFYDSKISVARVVRVRGTATVGSAERLNRSICSFGEQHEPKEPCRCSAPGEYDVPVFVAAMRLVATTAVATCCWLLTGASGKGVSVYLHADVLLRLAEKWTTEVVWLVIYKVRFSLADIFHCRRYLVSESN